MNKGYQGLVLAASLFAIGCETKEDTEACEQYATYVVTAATPLWLPSAMRPRPTPRTPRAIRTSAPTCPGLRPPAHAIARRWWRRDADADAADADADADSDADADADADADVDIAGLQLVVRLLDGAPVMGLGEDEDRADGERGHGVAWTFYDRYFSVGGAQYVCIVYATLRGLGRLGHLAGRVGRTCSSRSCRCDPGVCGGFVGR